VEVRADGVLCFDWEAGDHGWLQLRVAGDGHLEHEAVIEGDDYEQREPFGDTLPDWAATLLTKLLGREH
jgi:hypothetical protein